MSAGWRLSLMPRSIRGQIAAVMAGAFLASVITGATVFFVMPHHSPRGEAGSAISQLALAVRLVDATQDQQARAATVAKVQALVPGFAIEINPHVAGDVNPHELFANALAGELGPRFTVTALRPKGQASALPLRLLIGLPDGTKLGATLPRPPAAAAAIGLIGPLVFLGIMIALLSFWAARALARPLTGFADAAESFTGEHSGEPLDEGGPQEISRAARALNDMRARIRQLIEERTLMLAAVSHDLRTPVTRLRLRAEEIQPPELRRQFLADLLTMQNVIQSALWFLRGDRKAVRQVQIDLSSLAQTTCDGFVDMGRDVVYLGEPHLNIMGDPEQLTRALGNLVDNALKFGKTATVRVRGAEGSAMIEVEDDGPGIPDDEKQRATLPFYRGDAARNLDDGDSFGLGLSVAQAVAEAHGGRLDLLDSPRGGLLVRLTLPGRAAEVQHAHARSIASDAA